MSADILRQAQLSSVRKGMWINGGQDKHWSEILPLS